MRACRAFIRHYWFSPSPLAPLLSTPPLCSPPSTLIHLLCSLSLPRPLMKCTSRHDSLSSLPSLSLSLSHPLFYTCMYVYIIYICVCVCVYVDFLLFQPIIDARRLIDRRPRFSDLLLSRPSPPNVDSTKELDTPRFVKVLLFTRPLLCGIATEFPYFWIIRILDGWIRCFWDGLKRISDRWNSLDGSFRFYRFFHHRDYFFSI